MRLIINSVVAFLVLILIQSCADGSRNRVEEQAVEFMEAYRGQDIARMRLLYPAIDNIDVFVASDTSFVSHVIPMSREGEFQVEVVSIYMTENNTPEVQNVMLFFEPIDSKRKGYRIYDSKGIASWNNYPHSQFAVETGCIDPRADMTDQQATYRLRVAKDLLFYFSKLMYKELEENIHLTQTHILDHQNQHAKGKAVVENASDYTLPDLKYVIVYYDDQDQKIGEEGGWVTQSPIESGQVVAFEFETSYDKQATTADFKLDFDLELILQFVLNDDIYNGSEYEAFVNKKLIDI
ncbi:MAG: hypothetical protein ACRCSQ_08035 [Bacteroidales bacterium]